ncbi:MAG: hypothetical protein QOE86_2904 [Solirubrobacteraceae bacterium]|jgi:hypothetical protein|nr:hypothetical protein [Solirubrobacteraceae bacterium]
MMSTPTVIEVTSRPEPVVHDSFIDDLAPRTVLTTRKERPDLAGRVAIQR